MLNTALFTFRGINNGRYGDLERLVSTRLVGDNYLGADWGYRFFVIPYTNGYAAVAVPENEESGRFAYYTSPDRVIRYSDFALLAPSGQNGNPTK